METVSIKNNENVKEEKLTPNDFDFGKCLGEGGYGKVYHARKKTGKDNGTICAMKVMKKKDIFRNKKKIENVKSERSILEVIKHPLIVNLLYAFETEHNFYLGLEYMCGGDLFNYLEKVHVVPEHKACLFAAQVILAIKYLHEKSILYRDLKPDNILLDSEGHIKLSDFGLCKRLGKIDKTYTFCGTLDYMSPEMVQQHIYSKPIDWWGVGVLLYDMLTGFPPFTISNDRNMTMQNIKFGRFSFRKSPVIITMEAKDLICKLLKTEPSNRLGSGPAGAQELMNHLFFKNIKWENLLTRKLKPLIKKYNEDFNMEERTENFPKQVDDFVCFGNYDTNVFHDFDYISPNLLSDTFATHLQISQEQRC